MLKEITINKTIIRNRVVVAPMTTWAANNDLTVSDQEVEYYSVRSKDAGMVITGCTFFQENGQGFENQFFSGSDDYIPSLKKLAESIKKSGAKAILQIFHAGRMAMNSSWEKVSASAINPTHNSVGNNEKISETREMSLQEIDDFIQGFKDATRRAIEAGFNGIEIHGANTYLIQQFYSGDSNRRSDQWGGSRENRIKLPLAIVDAANQAKESSGKVDFIIGYRFSPEEIEPLGITLDDTLYLVNKLCNEKVDYLHISLGNYKQTSLRDREDKRVVGKIILEAIDGRKPLIGSGKIISKHDVEDALNGIGYDLIAIGHGFVTDPDWVSKVSEDLSVDTILDSQTYREKKIPDNLLKMIKTMPGWFDVK